MSQLWVVMAKSLWSKETESSVPMASSVCCRPKAPFDSAGVRSC